MSKTNMDFTVADLANYAADQGIDLAGDDETTRQLEVFRVHESFRAERAKVESKERRWFWGRVFGIVTAAITTLGVTYTQVRDEPPEKVEAADVKAEVTETADDASGRMDDMKAEIVDVQTRVGNVEEGVSASVELQLQQGEETRRMLLDAIPLERDRRKYKVKGDTLKRAESRASKAAEAVGG